MFNIPGQAGEDAAGKIKSEANKMLHAAYTAYFL